MNKVVKDGKVAVLYSPGYGAGYSTLAPDNVQERLCMDATILEPFIANDFVEFEKAVKEVYPDAYIDVTQLKVEWVYQNTSFYIEVHDGYERIHTVATPYFRA